MTPAERALEAVRTTALARRAQAVSRWEHTTSGAEAAAPMVVERLATLGRLTVNFHPDRIARNGETIVEGLADTGRYTSQWVTGISSGGRSAFTGGDRHRWEHELFGGAYSGVDHRGVDMPVYGAWDLLGDPHGGSPRFGSCCLVLADHVRSRSTICLGDSHAGPTDVGTFDAPWSVLAGLGEQADRGELLGVPWPERQLALLCADPAPLGAPRRDLDHYVELQVHGGVDLETDVEAMVIDPSFRHTAVHDFLESVVRRYDVALDWHGGSELEVERIPDDFRGPTMPVVGRRVARADGIVDAHSIGRAARDVVWTEPRASGDPPESEAQQLKYLWHTVLAFGSDAPTPTASGSVERRF